MDFASEFKQLNYVIKKSNKILLFAHSRPDEDTVGATLALREYLVALKKTVDLACFDRFPSFLQSIAPNFFEHPSEFKLHEYELVIACDSVDRGFDELLPQLSESQVTVLIDHHPDIETRGDINIVDPTLSSTCELVYNFLQFNETKITINIATYLMIGILGDTGNFQHANTSAKVMEIASDLMKHGAPISRIIDAVFSSRKLSTLKLWGRAFEKSKINKRNEMITTVLTKNDLEECNADIEDVSQISSILNTVPGAKFALVLSERNDGIVKGSLRSEEYKGVDVSIIAHKLGGGGHRLASGFEIHGKIIETDGGWSVV